MAGCSRVLAVAELIVGGPGVRMRLDEFLTCVVSANKNAFQHCVTPI